MHAISNSVNPPLYDWNIPDTALNHTQLIHHYINQIYMYIDTIIQNL